MRLNNDFEGFQLLYKTIISFYKRSRDRACVIFSDQSPDSEGRYYVRFLLDRKHVVQYVIGKDRGFSLGALTLGIGPHYFGPADFWSYENSQRFSIEATTDAVEKNLTLLDEFLVRNQSAPRPRG